MCYPPVQGWASKAHPDPKGEQLQHLIPILEAIVELCDEVGPTFTWGIVWDFMSLPQRGRTSTYDAATDDRSSEEVLRFVRGLTNINVWYGARYTHTLVLNIPMPEGSENATPYDRRGWCIFERSLSALIKDDYCYLELGEMSGKTSGWEELRDECKAHRSAPVAPDAFEKIMREGVEREEKMAGSGIKFTSGKDLTVVVIPQYQRAFLKLMGSATELMYTHLDWGDEEAARLAAAFQYAHGRGAMAQLQVNWRLTALIPCRETWHARSTGPTVSFDVPYVPCAEALPQYQPDR